SSAPAKSRNTRRWSGLRRRSMRFRRTVMSACSPFRVVWHEPISLPLMGREKRGAPPASTDVTINRWRLQKIPNPRNPLAAIVEEPIQPGDLGDEVVEAAVGAGELLERPDQQCAGAGGPEEQRQMRQVAAAG